ncbi:expressed protein [Phakopsora pachyrhizi]|uniref:Expressed protein n=1 Tax=Phakopsora pachyrhizi TaxID=170000 RepID=A0AAV0AXD2_PHAPC|nr:expressed protein [Phakopsora pachyrhizi]
MEDPPHLHVPSHDPSVSLSERELRLVNARKKLKSFRLKQALDSSPSNVQTCPGLNPPPVSQPRPLMKSHSPSKPQSFPSAISSTSRHRHTRTHSRNQSRSSLASILVSSDQVNVVDEALAHHRRLSASNPSFHTSGAESKSQQEQNLKSHAHCDTLISRSKSSSKPSNSKFINFSGTHSSYNLESDSQFSPPPGLRPRLSLPPTSAAAGLVHFSSNSCRPPEADGRRNSYSIIFPPVRSLSKRIQAPAQAEREHQEREYRSWVA